MKKITIAIDAMGGDHGPVVTVPACVSAVNKHPELKLLLVGDLETLKLHLKKCNANNHPSIIIVHATQSVAMDELPSHALRNKKNSSMRLAINAVKDGAALACVSSGNTGALMATAKFVLKTLPGIDRPAIISELPTINGLRTRVIDLGANVDSCAEHLFQFAVMGSALIQALEQQPNPKVALLNVGVEEIKGNDQVKRTAHMLSECSLVNYVGYIEGDGLYSGEVALVVCDGFVGNVALKASEGLAKLMASKLKKAFMSSLWSQFVGLMARPILLKFKKSLDPARYNGASLLGLNGIVIKSHGGADAIAFQFAIEEALLQVKNNVVELVREKINVFIQQGVL